MIIFDGVLSSDSIIKICQDLFTFLRSMIGKKFIVEAKESKPKRSLNQNSYLHAVVIKSVMRKLEESGYKDNEAGDIWAWIKIEVGHVNEKGIPKPSRNLTTTEFEELMKSIRIWASVNGIFIPQPNETDYGA